MRSENVENTLDDLYSEAYEYELDKREKTLGRLTLPVGAVTLISSAAVFFLSHLSDLKSSPARFAVVVPLALGGVCIAVTVYAIVRCLLVDLYRHLPSPQAHEKYVDELVLWATAANVTPEVIDEKFRRLLRNQKGECIAHNVAQNDRRTDYLSFSLRSLIGALICLCLAAFPYYAATMWTPPTKESARVEIVNFKDLNMANDQNTKPSSQPAASTPPQQPAPQAVQPLLVEPTPPPTMLRKEGSFNDRNHSITKTGEKK